MRKDRTQAGVVVTEAPQNLAEAQSGETTSELAWAARGWLELSTGTGCGSRWKVGSAQLKEAALERP